MTRWTMEVDTRDRLNTLRFLSCRLIARDTYEIAFEKPEGFSYQAGQSMKFLFKEPYEEKENRRSFSFVSAPHEEILRFAFRDTGSWRKQQLLSLRPGDTMTALGPRGRFVYPDQDKTSVIFIAGGIGVAPFVSMFSHAVHIGDRRQLILLCINRTRDDIAYYEYLQEISRMHLNMRVTNFLTRESLPGFEEGKMDETILAPFFAQTPMPRLYAAGTPAMLDTLPQILVSLGVPEENLESRYFDGYEHHVVAAH